MKKILVISDTYYPDSRATIAIVQRMAEEMAKRGHAVSVLPIGVENKKIFEYPKYHQGVKIENFEWFRNKAEKDYKFFDKINCLAYRIALAPKKLLVNSSKANRWNDRIMKIVRYVRKHIYEVPKKNIFLLKNSAAIKLYLQKNQFDIITSVSLPFEANICTSKALKHSQHTKWIPICFDPYAYDETISNKESERRIVKEHKVYKNAEKVMMLSQFENDYKQDKLKEVIEFFELPNIRKQDTELTKVPFELDENCINCVFLGNLYKIQRHPEFTFKLFEALNSSKIQLYMVGGLVDIDKTYIDEWVKRSRGKIHCFDRISQDEAVSLMHKADILVNIGNITENQCPSKLIDYVNTGKPILNISKIDKCTSIPYILKYPNAYTLSEKDGISTKVIDELEAFLLNCKDNEPIAYEVIEQIYKDCTMTELCNRLERVR